MSSNTAKQYRQIDDSAKPETVDVVFCIAPDGEIAYAWDNDSAAEVGGVWRESLTVEQAKEHEAAGTTGGFIQVRMLKTDFDKLEMTRL